MTDEKDVSITQSSGLGSSGDQIVNITKEIHNYPLVLKNLIKTHEGGIVFDPNGLRDVVVEIDKISKKLGKKPSNFDSIDLAEKNKINNFSKQFYDDIIARDYEPYFQELEDFLKMKENEDLHERVNNISQTLNRKINTRRDEFRSFEMLLLAIEESLIDSEYSALKNKESSVSLFLFFLYANCYIGKKTMEEMC